MMKFIQGIILLTLAIMWGCSSANDNTIALDASGKHQSGWVVAVNGGKHPASFMDAPEKCKECHGVDLKGGISKISCFSAALNGMTCHAQGPSGHPAGWNLPSAHGVHAKAAAIGSDGMAFCANCHGADYRGNGVSQKDCLKCHTTAPHPAKPWVGGTYTHTSTHPSNSPACAKCHTGKNNLSAAALAKLPATPTIGTGGCFDNTLCHGVMGHTGDPQPWSLPSNHGARAKADPVLTGNAGFSACQQCHGIGFNSVIGGYTCFSCHTSAPHPDAEKWRKVGVITHTDTAINNAPVCAACHNATTPNLANPGQFANSPAGSFKGGTPGCFNASLCHGDVKKTSDCDACHSTAATIPFKSLTGATNTSDSKVGAHVKHLNASIQSPAYSANIGCAECHTVPASPLASGTHRNGVNNVTFGTLAKTGSLIPVYTPANGSCVNTYCHGTTLPGGANKSPVWNQTNYLASGCATCHGFPPATASGIHTGKTASSCSSCHKHVNAAGNGFVTPSLHIDGKVDVTLVPDHPGAVPTTNPVYPGATHKSVATGSCSACHDLTGTGSYPASNGSPPKCAGCHLNGLNGGPGCADCHGDVTSGRPNGTAFPNRKGEHSNGVSKHSNLACTVCHPFTTGNIQHGWSNKQKSSAAKVGGAGTSIINWNAVNKSCLPACHGTETW